MAPPASWQHMSSPLPAAGATGSACTASGLWEEQEHSPRISSLNLHSGKRQLNHSWESDQLALKPGQSPTEINEAPHRPSVSAFHTKEALQ